MTANYGNDVLIRQKISETMEVEIDDLSERNSEKRFSRRLGSSQIGLSCSRQIWYGFRWSKTPEFGSETRPAGRVMRLFNRGHREEPILIELLKGIGCFFEATEEGQQHTFTACDDHAVTKTDAIGRMPPQFCVDDRVLFEFKTANFSSFAKMQKHGIQKDQPKYWSQVCYSGVLAGIDYVCILVVNKNDDNILIEFHKIDKEYGQMLVDKAMHIVTAVEPPLKISQSVTNFACKFCDFKDICHNNEPVEVNCRSCVFAAPSQNGSWVCTNPGLIHEASGCTVIPTAVIKTGCSSHQGID